MRYDLIVAIDVCGDGVIMFINPEISDWKDSWIDNEGNDLVEQINLDNTSIGVYAVTMVWCGDHESGHLEFETDKILWLWEKGGDNVQG